MTKIAFNDLPWVLPHVQSRSLPSLLRALAGTVGVARLVVCPGAVHEGSIKIGQFPAKVGSAREVEGARWASCLVNGVGDGCDAVWPRIGSGWGCCGGDTGGMLIV